MVNIDELKEFGLEITATMKEGISVIDIYTEWCGPCKFVAPVLEKLAHEGLIHLLSTDLDKNRPLGESFITN
jgi:thiol-disulfide isomerase/thioredoxin